MGIMMEAVDELLDIFMDNRVIGNIMRPMVELGLGGKLAVEDQIGSFEIRALLRNLFDRIAPVTQNSLIPVDVSNFALTGRGIHKAGVITHQTVILSDLDLVQ